MNRWLPLSLFLLLFWGAAPVTQTGAYAQSPDQNRNHDRNPLHTVDHVDLQRYSGQWYEAARIPNRWESECVSDVVVHYALNPDGTMTVRNDCVKKDGTKTASKGNAKVVDHATDAKLKVVFLWPFAADYWIIALDPEYQWAVVGQPDRKCLWVLSRAASLPPATISDIRRTIESDGYDSTQLVVTRQDGGSQVAPGRPGGM